MIASPISLTMNDDPPFIVHRSQNSSHGFTPPIVIPLFEYERKMMLDICFAENVNNVSSTQGMNCREKNPRFSDTCAGMSAGINTAGLYFTI
jgi:hypothetical protein